MIEFEYKGYKVGLCFDIEEWAKKFYDMPDGAIIENRKEMESECMGFSEISENKLWIFLPKKYKEYDFESTVAHEVGHLIEFKYKENPHTGEENDDFHEEKANHYESYYMIVRGIIDKSNSMAGGSFVGNKVSFNINKRFSIDEIKEAYETGRKHERSGANYTSEDIVEIWSKADELYWSIEWEK